MTSLLFRIKNVDTGNGWNVRIPKSVWIVSAETGYLLSRQKTFQNKLKNIYKVYQSVFFRCIMILSYRVAFLCNVFLKLIIHQKVLYDIFYEKVVKWCIAKENRLDYYNALEAYAVRGELGEFTGLVAELEEEQLDTCMKLSQR